ncbi:hypothetical protein ACFL4G_13450 [Thermodesulfobacteriota bacterium]
MRAINYKKYILSASVIMLVISLFFTFNNCLLAGENPPKTLKDLLSTYLGEKFEIDGVLKEVKDDYVMLEDGEDITYIPFNAITEIEIQTTKKFIRN